MTGAQLYGAGVVRRSPLLDFMEEHYEILPPAPITGPFLIRNSQWLGEPMHALSADPTIREVTMQLAAQGGKNLVSEGYIAYTVLHNPGNVLFYGQTDEDAERFAVDRALRRARSIEALKPIWPDNKGAAKNNQVTLGHLTLEFLGINASNARGKSAPHVICDEKHLQQWQGMGEIIKMRCSAFWDHKILNISTAGEEGSEIDMDYLRGTQEDWHLGCPACQRLIRLVWSQELQTIIWQAPPEEFALMHPGEGKWNFREVRKRVRFKCPWPDCGCEERDTTPTRREMNQLGGYVCDNPDAPPDHRSFHVSQIAFPWVPWELMVEKWIMAIEQMKTGDLSNLKTFVIERMGHTWAKRVSTASTAHVTGDYMVTDMVFYWELEKERFATIDVQARGGRHYWVCVRAWAGGGASRLIMAYRCESWEEVKRCIEENKVKPKRVGVDSRHATEEVKEMCAKEGWHYMVADQTRKEYEWRAPGVTPVRRPYKRSSWHDTVTAEGGKKVRRYAHGIIFSKDWVRKVLANRISGAGTEWGLPSDVGNLVFRGTAKIESSYMSQLNSWVEKEVEDTKTEEKKLQWVMINTDDHLRACEEMQLVLAAISGFFPSEITSGKTD